MIKEAFDFFGTYVKHDRDGVVVHSVEEAQDFCYNWVEAIEKDDGLEVVVNMAAPHLWAWGGQEIESGVKVEDLPDVLMRMFEKVRWNFPTRPQNMQPWSDNG